MRLRARRATAGVTDAVAAEVAEILTQFTPGGEQACVFKVAQRQRPDGALAVAVVRIGVVEVEFVLPAQGAADLPDEQGDGKRDGGEDGGGAVPCDALG